MIRTLHYISTNENYCGEDLRLANRYAAFDAERLTAKYKGHINTSRGLLRQQEFVMRARMTQIQENIRDSEKRSFRVGEV